MSQRIIRRQDRRTTTRLDNNEIHSLKPLNNFVLLRKMSDNRVGKLMGQEIRLDTTFNPEFYADVIYEVMATPKNLVYDNGRDEFGNYFETHGMEWKNRMDMRVGDIVWANYNQAINSLKITCGDDEYQLMHYSHIYLSIRKWKSSDDGYLIHYDADKVLSMDSNEDIDSVAVVKDYSPEIKIVEWKRNKSDLQIKRTIPTSELPENVMMRRDEYPDHDEISLWKVIMHNGYILFSEVPEDADPSGMITFNENKDRLGIARYIGRPNEEYREHSMWDDNKVRVGDMIHLAYKFSKKLENNPLIARFGDGHKLHVTQRHRILGVIPKKHIT